MLDDIQRDLDHIPALQGDAYQGAKKGGHGTME